MTPGTLVSVCCPVCGTWFYREPGTRTKYDKELCKKTGLRVAARKKAREKQESSYLCKLAVSWPNWRST